MTSPTGLHRAGSPRPQDSPGPAASHPAQADDPVPIAVIGLAARYPDAPDVESFWANISAGVDSLSPLGNGGAGTYGVLEGAAEFDAEYFGTSPREALIIDPQHRVLLECAVHALEDAGCDPARTSQAIGFFAGGSSTPYPEALRRRLDSLPGVDDWQIRVATGADFLATRVAYKLGLTGPAVTVQTACSTSLVAIHTAAQALLAGECDVAVAGGVSVRLPTPRPSVREGGVFSPDGQLRAFDAGGRGIVGGSGAGLVVLKLLDEAIADGDHIHAVLLGSAVNNDGADKIGFTAPSVAGQAAAIRAAQVVAGVSARTITYVEAHGTGTPLGDPIEVAALTRAYRADTADNGFCWLGSVKTNIGHTDAAAGVAGFIKAVLAVERGVIPPSLNFSVPNPEIDFGNTPFKVVTEILDWPPQLYPRRAGISALGVGGTNAHAIVEQPPELPSRPQSASFPQSISRPQAGGWQLLPLSAKTPAALDELTRQLGVHLAGAGQALSDVGWTLQTGRIHHGCRRFLVASSASDAAAALLAEDRKRLVSAGTPNRDSSLAFQFPGQGGQHPGMTRELYEIDAEFRADIDRCAELARPALGLDVRTLLYPEQDGESAERELAQISVAQPAVFIVEYALARLWQRWGAQPEAVVGHSLGAYAAACFAGVFSLEDALSLVVLRGRLLHGLPSGAMAAVALPEREVLPLLPDGLTVGAVNGPGQTTVAGPAGLLEEFVREFPRPDVEVRRLRITAAGHSALVDPILDEFESAVAAVDRQPPTLPVVSDTTGTWADPDALRQPGYWRTHMRQAVRFDGVISTLAELPAPLLLEVGPGLTLTSLARNHPAISNRDQAVQSLPHPADPTAESAVLLTAVGRLWLAGVELDWRNIHAGSPSAAPPRKVKLPRYPFQRRRYLVDDLPAAGTPAEPAAQWEPEEQREPGERGAQWEPQPPSSPEPPPKYPVAWAGAEPDSGLVHTAFREILGVTEVAEHTSFFDLGGDSVLASSLVAWLGRHAGVKLTVKDIFLSPTAGELAGRLREAIAGGSHV